MHLLIKVHPRSVCVLGVSPEPGNSPLPAQFQDQEGPRPIRGESPDWRELGVWLCIFYNLRQWQVQKRGSVNRPSGGVNDVGCNTHIRVWVLNSVVPVNYLEHILTHSKLSVLLLLLSVSTIINFKCIYMHTEKYITSVQPNGKKFGESLCYNPVEFYYSLVDIIISGWSPVRTFSLIHINKITMNKIGTMSLKFNHVHWFSLPGHVTGERGILLVGWSHMISSGKISLPRMKIFKVVGCSFFMENRIKILKAIDILPKTSGKVTGIKQNVYL